MKKKNAITLIALVITVIILLILAGIVLTISTNSDNGIVKKAEEADYKVKIEKAMVEFENKYIEKATELHKTTLTVDEIKSLNVQLSNGVTYRITDNEMIFTVDGKDTQIPIASLISKTPQVGDYIYTKSGQPAQGEYRVVAVNSDTVEVVLANPTTFNYSGQYTFDLYMNDLYENILESDVYVTTQGQRKQLLEFLEPIEQYIKFWEGMESFTVTDNFNEYDQKIFRKQIADEIKVRALTINDKERYDGIKIQKNVVYQGNLSIPGIARSDIWSPGFSMFGANVYDFSTSRPIQKRNLSQRETLTIKVVLELKKDTPFQKTDQIRYDSNNTGLAYNVWIIK